MTSHPLLRNVDILHELCALIGQPILGEHELGASLYDSEGHPVYERDAWNARRALFAVLMTCRTFMPVAINVLWRSLPNLNPLLGVLEYDAGEWQEAAESALNWARFEWYARRVKSICFREEDEDLPPFILNHAPLLPNLCVLRWGSTDLRLVRLFFLPSLRHFELMAPGYAEMDPTWLEEVHLCLDVLTTSTARLQGLRLSGCDTLISAQLRGFRHLKELTMPYPSLTPRVWHDLAMIPNLGQLDITYMDERGQSEDEWSTVSFTPGLSTTELLYITGSWEKMLSVVRDLPSTKIRDVEFMYPLYSATGPDCPSEWRDIAQMLLTKGVRSFEITQYSLGDGLMRNTDITTFEPLFAFNALEQLKLIFDPPGSVAITDADIHRLVSALPCLKQLEVSFYRAEDTCLTIQSLVYVATTSSKLDFLQIDINIEKGGVNLLPDPKDILPTFSPLYHLNLRLRPAPPPDSSLRLKKLYILANILSRLFPKLEYICTQGDWPWRITQGDWEANELGRIMLPDFY